MQNVERLALAEMRDFVEGSRRVSFAGGPAGGPVDADQADPGSTSSPAPLSSPLQPASLPGLPSTSRGGTPRAWSLYIWGLRVAHALACRCGLQPTPGAMIAAVRRRLPPTYPQHRWLFVRWRLPGSLPQARYPPPGKPPAGKVFVWMDRYLDTTRVGPLFLRRPEVAAIVIQALQRRGAPPLLRPVGVSGSGNPTTMWSSRNGKWNASWPASRTTR